MKISTFALTLGFLAFSAQDAQARVYSCFGLENQGVIEVAVTNVPKLLGTAFGAPVMIAETKSQIVLAIQQGDVETTVLAKAGAITFAQTNNFGKIFIKCEETR